MNRLSILLLALLTFTFVACQTETDTAGLPETTISDNDRAMVVADVDSQLASLDRDLADLEVRAATAPEDVREEIDGEIVKAREERRDINALQANLGTAEDMEDWRDTQGKIWEEIRDLDALITQARLEATNELADFQDVAGSEMESLDRDIARMEARASTMDESARANYDQQLAQLRERRDAFNTNWQEVQNATEENWRDVRNSFAEGWRDLRGSFYDMRVPDVNVDVSSQPVGNVD